MGVTPGGMQTIRLYDPTREPPGWMQVIQPHEFAAFATFADSGVVCDADGTPTNGDDDSCVTFDSFQAAEAFCRERVERLPRLRFDILDAAGLRRPPLLTVVHPSRAASMDGSPTRRRWNAYAAIGLFAIGPPLIWFDWTYYDGVMIMPTILGINALLIAIRLLVMNRGHVSAERTRTERIAQARGLPPHH
jgi:hypothetical protein